MRNFEHIHLVKGEAFIRDTGITVSEIVKRIVYENATQDMLKEYPNLTMEDIQEALEFAVYDLIETIGIWRNEGLTPLTGVEAYSGLLVEDKELTQEQTQLFLQTVFRNSRRAIATWWNFTAWVHETYKPQPDFRQHMPVASLIQDILSQLPRYEPTAHAEFELSEHLRALHVDYPAVNAIIDLLTDETPAYLSFDSVVRISRIGDKWINVQVIRQYEYTNTDSSRFSDFDSFIWRTSPLHLASLIIQKYGSELVYHVSDSGITFEFNLPVWDEADSRPS
jgi:uncharacterized protein (DUF433 family)